MFIAAARSLLDWVHPLLPLKPLAAMGPAMAWGIILAGLLVAVGARRSPRTSAFWASLCAVALGFLGFAVKQGSESVWMFVALAGTLALLWVILAPLFARYHKLCSSIIWTLAGMALLFDLAQLASWLGIVAIAPKSELTGPWIGAAFGMWQLIAVAVIAGALSYQGRLFQPWFRQLSLAHLGGTMVIYGVAPLFGSQAPLQQLASDPLSPAAAAAWSYTQAPSFFQAPLLYLTATAAAVLVSHFASKSAQGPDILERYRPFAMVGVTHIFLILFTIATLYPVLWVLKMAVTPQQGFILGINPVPRPIVQYVNAWRKGDGEAAACYRRALLQNFREVTGHGSACTDLICGNWRQHAAPRLLKQRKPICNSFGAIMALTVAQLTAGLTPPPDATKSPEALAAWRKDAAEKVRNARLKKWHSKTTALFPPAQRAARGKLFQEIIHQQRERDAHRGLFWKQVLNSVLVALATTLLGLFLACTAAYAFSRFRFPGRRMGLMAFLVSQMFPGTLMMIPLYILISRLGLLNSLMGLTLVYSTTSIPFCVWMLKGYFDTIPKELEEAALIDGASRTLIFWKIMLPLARPAIAVTALFSFMTAWNEFILAVTFMNDKTSFTLPVMLRQYVGSHNTEWGHFAAGAVLVSLPIILLFFVLQKHLVGGLTAGSVKG